MPRSPSNLCDKANPLFVAPQQFGGPSHLTPSRPLPPRARSRVSIPSHTLVSQLQSHSLANLAELLVKIGRRQRFERSSAQGGRLDDEFDDGDFAADYASYGDFRVKGKGPKGKGSKKKKKPKHPRSKMGQEQSTLVDDSTPTETLQERSLAAVADYINYGGACRIVVMTGAGISTAAGSMLPSHQRQAFFFFFF